MDRHVPALWDHGHIKFCSERTPIRLMEEAGLNVRRVLRAGRFAALAKSMVVVAERPASGAGGQRLRSRPPHAPPLPS